jgi:hypothetical protein
VSQGTKQMLLSTKSENANLCRGIFKNLDMENIQNKYTNILLILLRKT